LIKIDFLVPEQQLEKDVADIVVGKVATSNEIRDFCFWGKLAIAANGHDLFRPPVWPAEHTEIGLVADVALLDFFVSMEEILEHLAVQEQSEETYYFVEHDYAVRFDRDGSVVRLTGVRLMTGYPQAVALQVGFDSLRREVGCAAQRFVARLGSWAAELDRCESARPLLASVERLSHLCLGANGPSR
jgi:hypothetical protein